MSILRKTLAEIVRADLDELCTAATRETSELEFKEELPWQPQRGQPEITADRWVLRGDRIGDYARDKLLAELVAFANAEGGTLVLGVRETDDEPRRAEGLAPVPSCEDLAKRLADACEDVIEPRLPILEARAIPAADGDTSGFVVLRVGRSAAGPHRLKSDGQFYVRRGERSVKMTVREIRDAVLDLARRGDVIAEQAQGRKTRDEQLFGVLRGRANAPNPVSEASFLRASAFPTSRWDITNLTARKDLWWRGGEHNLIVEEGTAFRIGYPAREFTYQPNVALRLLTFDTHDNSFHRSLNDQGVVEAWCQTIRDRQPGQRPYGLLHLQWVISLVTGVLAQAEHLRRLQANDGAEFGLEVSIVSNFPLAPTWAGLFEAGPAAPFENVTFPTMPIGALADFDGVLNTVLRDIWNHCGVDTVSDVKADWARLLAAAA